MVEVRAGRRSGTTLGGICSMVQSIVGCVKERKVPFKKAFKTFFFKKRLSLNRANYRFLVKSQALGQVGAARDAHVPLLNVGVAVWNRWVLVWVIATPKWLWKRDQNSLSDQAVYGKWSARVPCPGPREELPSAGVIAPWGQGLINFHGCCKSQTGRSILM